MKTKFKKFKIRSAKDFSRKFRNLCEKWLLTVFTQPTCTKALCLTCWVLPRSPGRRALGHLLSCEGGFFTEPWHTSKSLRSMKGFEISLTTPVSSSLQGTPCDHLQKFFFALAKVCTMSGSFTSWFAPLYWKAALLKVTTAASTKNRHWRFYISFLDSYWRLREGLTLCSGVANFLLSTTEPEPETWQIQITSIPCSKIMSKKSLGSVASVNKNWYFETNESHLSKSWTNLHPSTKKKNLSGIGKAIRFPSSGPKPKPHDR